jgi:hypothetical protein
VATQPCPIDIGKGFPLNATSPSWSQVAGTNFPVEGWAFDAAADEAIFFQFRILKYGSGNITAKLAWYADTASSGDVVWGAALSAITLNTDTQDVETDGLATENTATDSHLGTTGQREHEVSITISNLDSVADGDMVRLRIRRVGSSGSDTMTGDAILTDVLLEYSDT